MIGNHSTSDANPQTLWISIQDAKKLLGVCSKTVYNMAKQGDLPGAYQWRKRWRIPPSAIEFALGKNRPGVQPGTAPQILPTTA